jgi:tetratricopeptide (TPR) repeat protein
MDGKEWQDQGLVHYQTGAYAEAVKAFAHAHAAYEQAGEPGKAAEMLNNQGGVYRMLQEWAKAKKAFLEARAQFMHLGDHGRQAQVTANLGILANAQGQSKEAVVYFEEAIAAFQAQGDRIRQSDTWRALSLAYFKQWRLLDALSAYSAALDCKPRLSLGQRFLRWLFRLPIRSLGGK